MLLSLIRMIQAFRDYQRNVSELSQLSDRELADIGLDRSDIPRVARRCPRTADPDQPPVERITPASLRALSLLPRALNASSKLNAIAARIKPGRCFARKCLWQVRLV